MPDGSYYFEVNYPETNDFSWSTGDPSQPQQTVNVQSSHLFHGFPNYSKYRLRIYVNFLNSYIPWLSISGAGLSSDNIKEPIGSSFDTLVNFVGMDLLASGSYSAEIIFLIEGFDGTYWNGLVSKEITFNLTVSNGNIIKTEKDLYVVYYNKSSNSISGETTITVINNDNDIELFFEGDGSTFYPGNSFTDQFQLLFATGNQLPYEGEYEMNAFLQRKENGVLKRIYPFKIKVLIIDADVVINPKSLKFEVRKSIQEIKNISVCVINPFGKAVTISGPNWLTIDPAVGSTTFDFTVSNINPVTLSGGVITGNLEVKYDAITIVVPVELKVIQFFTNNFQEEYNFCLDNKIINVYKNLEAARFVRITATMKFRTPDETSEIVIPYTVPYFKDEMKLEIGKKIHRFFIKNRTSIFEEGRLIYHFDNKVHLYPCEASFRIEELDINQVSVYEESFSGIKFYPGKRPKCFPFLTNFGIRSRVYDSKHIFSFISGLVTAEELFDINVTKNGLEAGCIARVKVERTENKITWSDEKDITGGDQVIKYYNIAEGKDLVNVQWENQNLSPESITFKGLSSKASEFTHLFQDNVFTGTTEKFDTTAVRTLNINTGFILKSEEALIEELMFSKFCILEMEGKYITAAPSSSKIITEDKTRQLIEFDLEFKINGN